MTNWVQDFRDFFGQFFTDRSSAGVELTNPRYFMPIMFMFLAITLIVIFRKKLRQWKHEDSLRTSIGVFVLLLVPALSWMDIYNSGGNIRFILPLQLCSFAFMLSGLMMIRKSHTLFSVVYFMGLIGGIAGLFIPAWNIDPGSFRYWEFYSGHSLIIINSFYMIAVHRFEIRLTDYARGLIVTSIIGLLTLPVNIVLGTNYFFSMNGPSELGLQSLVHPLYYFIWQGALAAAFFIFYIPWGIRRLIARRAKESTHALITSDL